MTFDLEHSDTNYSGATPDSVDDKYYVGVAWENSAQTTGKLRFGDAKRDVSGGKKSSKLSWEAGVVWAPLDRDAVSFMTGRKIVEVDQMDTLDTNYSVAWKHEWLDRLNTEVGYGTFKTEYLNAVVPREDNTDKIRLAVNYQMRRWVVLHAGVESTDRDSSSAAFDSKRNIFTVGALLSL